MTMFSRKTELSLNSIVAAGHNPIIHSVALKDGWADIAAGNPLVITADGADAWGGAAAGGTVSGLSVVIGTADVTGSAATGDGTVTGSADTTTGVITATANTGDGALTASVDFGTKDVTGSATVTSAVMGIALNTPLEGDGSVLVLLHGCYRKASVTVDGALLTWEQTLTLMAAGLYPEDSWGD